jgi:hypothetical protein
MELINSSAFSFSSGSRHNCPNISILPRSKFLPNFIPPYYHMYKYIPKNKDKLIIQYMEINVNNVFDWIFI